MEIKIIKIKKAKSMFNIAVEMAFWHFDHKSKNTFKTQLILWYMMIFLEKNPNYYNIQSYISKSHFESKHFRGLVKTTRPKTI